MAFSFLWHFICISISEAQPFSLSVALGLSIHFTGTSSTYVLLLNIPDYTVLADSNLLSFHYCLAYVVKEAVDFYWMPKDPSSIKQLTRSPGMGLHILQTN